MDIYQCQREAEKMDFEGSVFDAHFPNGTFTATWLDAYMGIFTLDIPEMSNSFISVRDVERMFPSFTCDNLRHAEAK